jgi:hypothetical protein
LNVGSRRHKRQRSIRLGRIDVVALDAFVENTDATTQYGRPIAEQVERETHARLDGEPIIFDKPSREPILSGYLNASMNA